MAITLIIPSLIAAISLLGCLHSQEMSPVPYIPWDKTTAHLAPINIPSAASETELNGGGESLDKSDVPLIPMNPKMSKTSILSGLNHTSWVSHSDEFSFLDKEAGCDITIHQGTLRIKGCKGHVNVTTIYLTTSVHCDYLNDVAFYGPMSVQNGKCEALLMGHEFCDTDQEHPHAMHIDCNPHNDWKIIGLYIGLLTTLLISGIFSRITYVRYVKSPKGMERISNGDGFFRSMIILRERREDIPTYTKKAILPPGEEEAINMLKSNAKRTSYRVNPRGLLLVSLFMNSFFTEIPSASCLDFSTLHLSEGQQIGNRYLGLSINSSNQQFPVLFRYYSGEFTSTFWQDWQCTQGSCNMWGDCDEFGALGKWTSPTLHSCEDSSTDLCRHRRFCKIGTTGCFAKYGCLRWVMSYRVKRDSLIRVYDIGQSYTTISIKSYGPASYRIVDSQLTDLWNPSGYSLVQNSGNKTFLCRMSTNKGTPYPGMLGDLQFGSKLNVVMSWFSSTCRAQAEIGVTCDTIRSFAQNIPDICTLLPATVGSFEISYSNGLLKAKKDMNLKLIIESGKPLDLLGKPSSCAIGSSTVFGTKDGATPYQLILKSSTVSIGGKAKFRYSCTQTIFEIDCDMAPHSFEIPSVDTCRDNPRVDKVVEIESKDIDLLEKDTLGSHYYDNFEPPVSDYLRMPSILGLLMAGSTGIMVMVALFVCFICKR